MSCLDMQEAPGRQAVGSVQAGRQQEEQKAIMEVSLQKTGKTLPFFLSYEEEKQGVTKREAVSHCAEILPEFGKRDCFFR